MEKKEIKISVKGLILFMIIAILVIAVIIMGIQISNQNKALEESKTIISNKDKEIQKEINDNNKNITENTNTKKDVNNSKPKSIIINGWIDYLAEAGYGAERDLVNKEDYNYGILQFKDADKYRNKKYSLYIKNQYLGETEVEPAEGEYDNIMSLHYINFPSLIYNRDISLDILIDAKYNAIPRTSKISDLSANMKKNLTELSQYSIYEVEKIDLDGDNKFEYIVAMRDEENRRIGKSKVVIVNEDGKKIADLVNITNGNWTNTYDEMIDPTYMYLSYFTYIDLDNDGIMEILVHLPSWEDASAMYTVFEYENGKINGNAVVMNLNDYP